MNQKGFAPVLILLVVLAVGAVGYILIPKPGGIEYIKSQLTWPRPTPTPTPPPGCYYDEVVCIQAPCPPVLVCPSPTPTTQGETALPPTTSPANTGQPRLQDPIANWKVYDSKEHRLSIRYPQNWFLDISGDRTILLDDKPIDGTLIVQPDQVAITIDVVTDRELIDAYRRNIIQGDVSTRVVSSVSFDYIHISDRTTTPYVVVAQTVHQARLYRLRLTNESHKKTFDQILSTFRFD